MTNRFTCVHDCVIVHVRYIMYNNWLPEHALVAVRILHAVCQSTLVQPKIVSILTDDEASTSSLCGGSVCHNSKSDSNKMMLTSMSGFERVQSLSVAAVHYEFMNEYLTIDSGGYLCTTNVCALIVT